MDFFEGTLRSGKSATAVKSAIDCLRDGGVIGLNFDLVENWSTIYARRMLPSFAKETTIMKLSIDLYERAFRVGNVESLYVLSEKMQSLVKGRRSKSREEKGMIIFDECGLFFNSRDWENNKDYINFFTNSGKLQWEIILISHSFEDIDKQIRAKIEYLTTFRNMKKLHVMGLPIASFLKKPVFRSVTVLAGRAAGKGMKMQAQWHRLNMDTCDLYDTFTLFEHGNSGLDLNKLGNHPEKIYEEMKEKKRLERYFRSAPASPWPQYA